MPTEVTEKNYKCSDPQLNEIHKALIQEFEAVSKKQNEQKIRLFNGLFQQEIADRFLYKFDVPNEPEKTIEPDKPYILSIDGKTVNGSICFTGEKYIEVELDEDQGKIIPCLDIIIDLRILLDLIDRRIVLLDKEPSKFKISSPKFLFALDNAGYVQSLSVALDHTKRKDIPKGLTLEQEDAIRKSLQSRLAIIWGPPGTGKTKTLEGAIAELLKNGKKILFASNTNNAIDGLLKDLLTEKKRIPYDIFYELREEGKIVRIGSQTDEEIKKVFSPKAASEHKSQKTALTIRELEERLNKEKDELSKLETELSVYNRTIQLKDQISDSTDRLNQIPSNEYLLIQLQELENDKDSLFSEFSKYQPTIFSNTNALSELVGELKDYKGKLVGINANVNKARNDISSIEKSINNLNQEFHALSKSITRFFKKQKLNELKELLEKGELELQTLESNLLSYEALQKNLIVNEAKTTGQFISEFEKLTSTVNSSKLDIHLFNQLCTKFDQSIKLNSEKPSWLSYAQELGLIGEEKANEILFLTELSSFQIEGVSNEYQLRKNKLQNQIEENNKLRLGYEHKIQMLKEELKYTAPH